MKTRLRLGAARVGVATTRRDRIVLIFMMLLFWILNYVLCIEIDS